MKDIKLSTILINNILHISILLLPIIIYFILSIIFIGSLVAVLIASIVLVIFIFALLQPIIISCKIIHDLVANKVIESKCEVESISSSWAISSFMTKKKYVQDLFKSNYWNMISISLATNDSDDIKNKNIISVELYIKNKELEKSNFYKFYDFSYGYKEQFVEKKQMGPIMAKVIYYKHSRIVKNIEFYKIK